MHTCIIFVSTIILRLTGNTHTECTQTSPCQQFSPRLILLTLTRNQYASARLTYGHSAAHSHTDEQPLAPAVHTSTQSAEYSSPSRLSARWSMSGLRSALWVMVGGRNGHVTPTILQLLFSSEPCMTDWTPALNSQMSTSCEILLRLKGKRDLTSCVCVTFICCYDETCRIHPGKTSIMHAVGCSENFCWMISVNTFLFCCLGADLRCPSAELHHVGVVAVPQPGLCPHALSLHHCPGGHVFPGHCIVFPGWQREGWETVSDSDIVWITHHYFMYYLVIHSLNI